MFFMALKRRKYRLIEFKLISSIICDDVLYYFTAFIMRHPYFEKFVMTGYCFEESKATENKIR